MEGNIRWGLKDPESGAEDQTLQGLGACGHDGRVLKSAGNDGKRLTPQHGAEDQTLQGPGRLWP